MPRLRLLKQLPGVQVGELFKYLPESYEWITADGIVKPLWLAALLDSYKDYPEYFTVITDSK